MDIFDKLVEIRNEKYQQDELYYLASEVASMLNDEYFNKMCLDFEGKLEED